MLRMKSMGFNQNLILARNYVTLVTENAMYLQFLKIRISGSAKQLREKNAIIIYLTTQLATKSEDTSANHNLYNCNNQKGTVKKELHPVGKLC